MRSICLILIVFTLLLSCYDNEETKTIITVDEPPKVIISANKISGRIISESTQMSNDIRLKFNQSTFIPSHFNYFCKNGINVGKYNEKFEITNSKGELFEYSISSIENDINYVEISLFDYKETIFAHDVSQSWTLSQHTIAYSPHNSFIDQQQYGADVIVKFRAFDMKNVNEMSMIPNSRVGLRSDRSRGFLKAEDVFYFKATTHDNKNLVLRNLELPRLAGETAVYKFNASLGVWEKLETHTNASITYFDLSEAGFYCIGSVVNGIWAEGQLIAKGQPLIHEKITMKYGETIQTLHTTSNGKWLCYLPSNSMVEVIINNQCIDSNNSFISTDIQNLNNLSIEVSDINSITISGHLKDCVGQDISDGILYLPLQDKFIFTNSPTFNFSIAQCQGTNTEIILMKASTGEILQKTTWASRNNSINIGEWWVCSNFDSEYFIVNTEKSINEFVIKSITPAPNQRLSIYAENTTNNNQNIILILPDNPNEAIAENFINMGFTNLESGNASFNFNCLTSTLGCGFENLEVREFYRMNKKYYHGMFYGTFWVKDNNSQHAKNEKLSGHFIFEYQ